MTTFSFYKPEGRSSYMLNVSVEEEDNLRQSSKDKQVKTRISFVRSIPNPAAFYNLLALFTERIVQEARICWNQMSCHQRAQFVERSSEIIKSPVKGKAKKAQKCQKRYTSQNVKTLSQRK
ncbi:uncharacterized protein LOC110178963 [Drosophila serrata]|uniref:uncharacterized protein LOC110178963 n=1 Tax=Drosophila serrata TaxID=7274 RepID=UPI000A1CF42C|nr:uncharacterized protein LOC110178963 [Drosophila serrata]